MGQLRPALWIGLKKWSIEYWLFALDGFSIRTRNLERVLGEDVEL